MESRKAKTKKKKKKKTHQDCCHLVNVYPLSLAVFFIAGVHKVDVDSSLNLHFAYPTLVLFNF